MRFSPLVDRIAGHGANAWGVHFEAQRQRAGGRDVIFLTVGDPDQAPPAAVLDREAVAVPPTEGFGPSAVGHLRISPTQVDAPLEDAGQRIVRFARSLA